MSISCPQIDQFLEMLSAERGAAANTLSAYRRDLEDFLSMVKAQGRDALSAGPDDIDAAYTRWAELDERK